FGAAGDDGVGIESPGESPGARQLAVIDVALYFTADVRSVVVKRRTRKSNRGWNGSEVRKGLIEDGIARCHEVDSVGRRASLRVTREGVTELLDRTAGLLLQQLRRAAGIQVARHHGHFPAIQMLQLRSVLFAQVIHLPVPRGERAVVVDAI